MTGLTVRRQLEQALEATPIAPITGAIFEQGGDCCAWMEGYIRWIRERRNPALDRARREPEEKRD